MSSTDVIVALVIVLLMSAIFFGIGIKYGSAIEREKWIWGKRKDDYE